MRRLSSMFGSLAAFDREGRSFGRVVGLLACAGTVLFGAAARADEPSASSPPESSASPSAPVAENGAAPLGEVGASSATPPGGPSSEFSFWQAQVGVRTLYVADPGYDPFSSDDALVLSSVGLSRTVWELDRFSFAPGAFWDHSAHSSTARGSPSSLDVDRFGIGLEGRYHLMPGLYVLARFTPSLLREEATIDDAETQRALSYSHWVTSFDATGGAAVRLPKLGKLPVRVWVLGEGGYAWAQRKRVVLSPDEDAGGPEVGSVTLGDLALRGGFFRLAAAVTY